jgi:hypothetical protein
VKGVDGRGSESKHGNGRSKTHFGLYIDVTMGGRSLLADDFGG